MNLFSDIWAYFQLQDRVSYHSDLIFEKNPYDLLIYDESDHILFNDPQLFEQFTSNNSCVCFTATPGGEDKNLEEKVL